MPALSDWRIRKLGPDLRAELFSYVPRHRLLGMDRETLRGVLRAYGREDLYRAVVGDGS